MELYLFDFYVNIDIGLWNVVVCFVFGGGFGVLLWFWCGCGWWFVDVCFCDVVDCFVVVVGYFVG